MLAPGWGGVVLLSCSVTSNCCVLHRDVMLCLSTFDFRLLVVGGWCRRAWVRYIPMHDWSRHLNTVL